MYEYNPPATSALQQPPASARSRYSARQGLGFLVYCVDFARVAPPTGEVLGLLDA